MSSDLTISLEIQSSFPVDPDDIVRPPTRPPQPRQCGPLWLQLGANAYQGKFVAINAMNTQALGGSNGDLADLINVVNTNSLEISGQLGYLDYALKHVVMERAHLGAIQNRLDFTIERLGIASENLQASESRIRDADMVAEMTRFTRNNILFQTSTAMLAQANTLPQSVLQLLG